MTEQGWIGVDLDGTLAVYGGWNGGKIGAPIPEMVERVKKWLAEGKEVKIMTARVGRPDPTRVSDTPEKIEAMRQEIQDWCEEHVGKRLEVTNEKDYNMLELWDDRAVQVETNTGVVLQELLQGAIHTLVERGMADIRAGRTISNEEMFKRIQKRFKRGVTMDSIDKAIDVMNRFLKTDPDACRAFIEHEVSCNDTMVDDPDIQVGKSEDGSNRIRPLGLINGILGAIPEGKFKGWGPICAVVEQDGSITKFARTETTVKLPDDRRDSSQGLP